jgi:hypothetical protein
MIITGSDLKKYNHIENLILNCLLGKSNINPSYTSYELLYDRLTNLKPYIDAIISNVDINILLHDRIHNILSNTDLISLYGKIK